MHVATRADGLARRRRTVYFGNDFARRPYFTSEPGGGPQAYLVEQAPSSTVRAHFHRFDQFQVAVAGEGRLGRRPLQPVAVLYTDGATSYGPIDAGPDGLFYFTLRARTDPGANYLPESVAPPSDRTPRRRQRLARVPGATAPEPGAVTSSTLIETEHDGLAVSVVAVGPGATTTVDGAAPDLDGVYVLVVVGSVRHRGRLLDEWSCVFLEPGDGPIVLDGGEEGGTALAMRFPRRHVPGLPGVPGEPAPDRPETTA